MYRNKITVEEGQISKWKHLLNRYGSIAMEIGNNKNLITRKEPILFSYFSHLTIIIWQPLHLATIGAWKLLNIGKVGGIFGAFCFQFPLFLNHNDSEDASTC